MERILISAQNATEHQYKVGLLFTTRKEVSSYNAYSLEYHSLLEGYCTLFSLSAATKDCLSEAAKRNCDLNRRWGLSTCTIKLKFVEIITIV